MWKYYIKNSKWEQTEKNKQTEHADKEMTNVSWPTMLDSEKWSLAQQ